MSKVRPISADGRKAGPRALHEVAAPRMDASRMDAPRAGAANTDAPSTGAPRRLQPMDVTRKLAVHQATQTLRVAADVLIGVDCGDPLLNFRVRGLASAVRAVAAELDAVLVADDRLFARSLGSSAE